MRKRKPESTMRITYGCLDGVQIDVCGHDRCRVERKELTMGQLALEIQALKARFPSITRVVLDAGGFGKSVMHELKATYGIDCEHYWQAA